MVEMPRRLEDAVSARLSLGRMERALRSVTERLPGELAPDASPPCWSRLEWRLAPAVAAMHGIAPILAAAPRGGRPRAWIEFVELQRAMTAARHRRIADLLERVRERAHRAGIALLPLKGAALAALGLYAAGERPMADLDLLVAEADVNAAARELAALGYRASGASWKHRLFDPADASARTALGEHADNPVKIDLHVRVRERLPLEEHDFTDLVLPARAEPGLNAYPSRAALLTHVLAHAAGNMVHRGVRLLQLEDISRLAQRMEPRDWEEILRLHGMGRRLWWAAAPLLLAARYRPLPVPHPVLTRLSGGCPRLLRAVARRRTLTDFSYSHARIDPVPGIVWTRSSLELARYVASRVRPGRQQRAQLDLLAHTAPWAAAPEWYAQSQTRRIARWLISRPMRVETMLPVKAALALSARS